MSPRHRKAEAANPAPTRGRIPDHSASLASEEALDPAERLAMARRYLGSASGDRYVTDNPDPERENVAFRMRPAYWLSQDQGKGQAAG